MTFWSLSGTHWKGDLNVGIRYRKTNTVLSHLSVESETQNKTRQKQTHRYRELMFAKGERGGKMDKIGEKD